MITEIKIKVMQIAHKASKIPGLKKLLKPIYKACVLNPLQKMESHKFNKNALNVIQEFDSCMTKNGFDYFLIFGSLLGAVREHGFISHDFDIDVAMWHDDFSDDMIQKLADAGFVLDHKYEVDGGRKALEMTFVKDGVGIDVFFYYPPIDEYPYTTVFFAGKDTVGVEDSIKKYGGMIPVRYQAPLTKEYERVPFESLMLPIPKTAHQILACTYGDSYMIPNPNWVGGSFRKYATTWDSELGIHTKFNH